MKSETQRNMLFRKYYVEKRVLQYENYSKKLFCNQEILFL
jgi:hypothetical protein